MCNPSNCLYKNGPRRSDKYLCCVLKGITLYRDGSKGRVRYEQNEFGRSSEQVLIEAWV